LDGGGGGAEIEREGGGGGGGGMLAFDGGGKGPLPGGGGTGAAKPSNVFLAPSGGGGTARECDDGGGAGALGRVFLAASPSKTSRSEPLSLMKLLSFLRPHRALWSTRGYGPLPGCRSAQVRRKTLEFRWTGPGSVPDNAGANTVARELRRPKHTSAWANWREFWAFVRPGLDQSLSPKSARKTAP
jgi:hypothetical protein